MSKKKKASVAATRNPDAFPNGTKVRLKNHCVWNYYSGVVEKQPEGDQLNYQVRLNTYFPSKGTFLAWATAEQMEKI